MYYSTLIFRPASHIMSRTTKIMVVGLLCGSVLSGCSLLRVYKIDIPQGTPLTQPQVAKIRPGMSQADVSFILGSPTFTDTLNPREWRYTYTFKPGTYAKQDNIPKVTGGEQTFIIKFDDKGIVTNISGGETIPATQPGIPTSKDSQLYSEPL